MKAIKSTDQTDLVFRAFSDPTRLRILHLLRGGELCVCDLVTALDAPQPKVSRHLAYLRRADLVRVRKEGLWSHYSLAPPGTPFHARLLECLGACFGEVPEMRRDAARLKRTRCCDGGGNETGNREGTCGPG